MLPFLQLPQLLPLLPDAAASASLRLVISDRPIGFADPEETIVDVNGTTTVVTFQNLADERFETDFPSLLDAHSDPGDEVFGLFYFGMSGFVHMTNRLLAAARARPNLRAVVLTCGCISPADETVLRSLQYDGLVRYVGWCVCGGTREMHAARLALAGTPAVEALRLTPGLPRDNGLSLGA